MSRNPGQNVPLEFQNLFQNVINQIHHDVALVGAHAPNDNPGDAADEDADMEATET